MAKINPNDPRYETIVHPIPPVYYPDSEILILGSFPSVKTRDMGFAYGHPQNRFWKILAALYGEELPLTIPERRALLKRQRIAIWDVIEQCDIIGSADATIKNVVPTDLRKIVEESQVARIYCNGGTSAKLYRRYQEPLLVLEAKQLLSSSPANAAYSLEDLIENWRVILGE